MWTDRANRRARLLMCIGLCALYCGSIHAQQGQYRSRVLIDPNSTLGQGTNLSLRQLEQQLDSLQEPYAQSSAGRHLARQYLQKGQYQKAVDYYQVALQAGGLSAIANREMRRELAQVYLRQKNYRAATITLLQVLESDLVAEAADYLLLARAYYSLGDYVAVVATLDRAQAEVIQLDVPDLRQAMALYYRAGAYSQSAKILHRLLRVEPHNPDNWHQLVAVYLRQGKRREALNQLTLAREKGIPFSEQNTLLLADLQASEKTPYAAAITLEQALASAAVSGSGENYRKLFEFWLQARELEKATGALATAAQLTGDTVLYLHLAQLQMEAERWQTMQEVVLRACRQQLEDRYVSRANLLLGVSQLKLDDREAARRSFINATLIGGANAQAGQWLAFMDAAPATEREARRIVSPCYGSDDKRRRASSAVAKPPAVELTSENGVEPEPEPAALSIRVVPAQRFMTSAQKMRGADINAKTRGQLVRMNVALVRAGGTTDGPAQLLSNGPLQVSGDTLEFLLALPVRGAIRATGRYKLQSSEDFRCAWSIYRGKPKDLMPSIISLAERAVAAGHELTGDWRLVLAGSGGGSSGQGIEIQLGLH